MAESPDNVLIVGAGGFLGRSLFDVPFEGLRRVPAVHSVGSPYAEGSTHRLDITSAEEVEAVLTRVKPTWVINTAALTSVDGCETYPEQANQLHVEGTRHLVDACAAVGSGLVSISTNYVFDGTDGPYSEEDAPNPLNVYGCSKLEGEALALSGKCPAIVVRTAVLYGFREGCRPNFVTWAAGALAKGQAISVVTDECANPTYVDELAVFLLSVCQSDFRGVVHFAGLDHLSRYDMVSQICACYGLDMSLVTATTSADFGQPADRPLSAGLRVGRASGIVSDRRRSFTENLDSFRGHFPELRQAGQAARPRRSG